MFNTVNVSNFKEYLYFIVLLIMFILLAKDSYSKYAIYFLCFLSVLVLIYCCRNGDLVILFCEQLCKDSTRINDEIPKENQLKTKIKNKNGNNNKNNHNRKSFDERNTLALRLSKTYQFKSKLVDSILSKEIITKLKVNQFIDYHAIKKSNIVMIDVTLETLNINNPLSGIKYYKRIYQIN